MLTDLETWLLIGFILLDVCFLGFSILEHRKEYKFREKEFKELQAQTRAMQSKKKKKRKYENNPSER